MATNNPENDQKTNAEQKAPETPIAGLSQTDDSENTSQPAESTQHPSYKKKALEVASGLGKWTFWECASIVGEVLLAAAVAYYAYVQASVSEGQLDAMKTQNDEMVAQRKEMAEQTKLALANIAEMRADRRWITASRGDGAHRSWQTRQLKVTLTNTGSSPAYLDDDIIAGMFLDTSAPAEPPDFETVSEFDTTGIARRLKDILQQSVPRSGRWAVLPPNGETPVYVPTEEPLTQSEYDRADGTGIFYCIGRVQYTDINGKAYQTTFSFYSSRGHVDRHSEAEDMK